MPLFRRRSGPVVFDPKPEPEDLDEVAWREITAEPHRIRVAPRNLVTGEQHHQSGLEAAVIAAMNLDEYGPRGYAIPTRVTFVRDADNQHDPNAWQATINGLQVGWLRKEVAALTSPLLDANDVQAFTFGGIIRGGWNRESLLGVHIWPDIRFTPGPTWQDELIEEYLVAGWPPDAEDAHP